MLEQDEKFIEDKTVRKELRKELASQQESL